MPLTVLYEDNHLLAVCKPAGVATMGAAAGEPSLVETARQYIKQRYQKPGNVYLGVVSRLDAAASGAVLLARTSKAAARLTELFRERQVQKIYLAWVEGDPGPSGSYTDWVWHDDDAHRVRVVSARTAGAKEAALAWRRLRRDGDRALVEVDLGSGRKHQIRVQFAARGHAILGDRKYGARQGFVEGIALHCRRLALVHPVRREPIVVEAPLPASWRRLGGP